MSDAWAARRSWGALVVLAALSAAACRDEPPPPGPSLAVRGPRHPPAPVEALRRAILDSLALRPGMTVAEIGLGRGWFVFRAAQAVGRTGAVYATDIDPGAIRAMQRELPHIDPAAAPVTLRLCRDGHDTALDDLPDGRLDVVLMIDSLCFADLNSARDDELAYLRRFLRMLKPGGRLVHHMDCNCSVSRADVEALFREAGFAPHPGTVPVVEAPAPADWACHTDEALARQAWVGVFRKSGG